ncbi:MAG: hypothetical protein ACD_58C00239G0011 [uncultured bacterium]|nr:MAG: hypothetical protein ACD_58C00239G0011 [uncultured bacterium]
MGQKANPNSVRLVINKDWKSKWFSQRNFTIFFLEDIKLKKALLKKLGKSSGIANINIQRNPQQILITIYSSKPGIIIGRSGQGINDLTHFLEKELNNIKKSFTYNVQKFIEQSQDKKTINSKIKIDIVEVRDPELNAELVAQNITLQLEKRIAYRRAVKQAINKVMQKKAKGVKVHVAGRLGGVEIARSEGFSEGSIPLGTFKANVDYAFVPAHTVYGIIGVKVWIYK